MSLKSNDSFEERNQRNSIGQQNLAYAQSETNETPLDHEEIQMMERRQANSDPPSYNSKASSDRASFSDNDHILEEGDVITTNYDLNKAQEAYVKSNLDKNNNDLLVNNLLNVNKSDVEKSEKMLKNDQFDSVIFKGVENKKMEEVQK
jgi:hypothetical protein